jgi:serine/threonine protein kinase
MQEIPHSGRSLIGHGGSSSVYLIDNPHGPGKLAIKEYDASRLDKSVFMREIELLVRLNHPCIVRIFGYFMPSKSRRADIQMEYAANGSLRRVLALANEGYKLSFWTGNGVAIIICGIVLGMCRIHSQGLIHQDLKPDNILLNDRGHPLIADFGTTHLTNFDDTPIGAAGTVHYAAPEQFKEEIQSATPAIDVFSFGLILYEIIVGRAVFPQNLMPFEVIRMHNDDFRPEIPDHVCHPMRDLIMRCWSPNPADRPSFDAILSFIESNHFDIVPYADPKAVHAYVNGVRDWDRDNREASISVNG